MRRRIGLATMCLAAAVVGGVSGLVYARPVYEIRRTAKPPVIDGLLDDACWQEAAALTDFTQVLPIEGAAPTERTEVLLIYDAEHLYIAGRCYDTEPRKIIATQMQHDSFLDPDDKLKFAFDTFFRQREGYWFTVNPAGARVEGLIENFGQENRLWDTVWQARCRIDSQGWTAEIAIPFKSLSFDPKQSTWGFNVERLIRRKQETVRWTALSRTESVLTLSDFGELRGLSGMHQGLGVETRPFLSTKYRDDSVNDDRGWDIKPGGDLTYNITPSLKANATVNTDFAETEVDDRVVNLTRFPLFFPEKRDFFLQDSALFKFGGLSRPTPYYSRRIGLAEDGTPVDIVAGGRLTGRVGDTRVALLDVQQDSIGEVDSKNLFVGRVSTRVLEESDIGLVATHGDPLSNGSNTLLGFDFDYVNSRLPGDKQLLGNAWVMGTSSDREDAEDTAFGGNLRFPNEPLYFSVSAWEIGDKFDPALGFVQRRGIREYAAAGEYTWRPNKALVRSFSLGVETSATTNIGSRVVAEEHDIPYFVVRTPAGDSLVLRYTYIRDLLEEPFEIHDGVSIPAGDYHWLRFRPTIVTSQARPVSGYFEFATSDYYTGTRRDYGAGISWRPGRYFNAGVDYLFNQIRLPEGDFDVRVASMQLNITFTPDLSWNNIVQYDNISSVLGLNSRVRWTYSPGSDLFFVVNQGYDYEDRRIQELSTEITMKVVATFRF